MNKYLIIALALNTSLAFSAQKDSLKHSLKDEIKLNEQSKVVKILSNPSFKLIGLGFKKGQVLEKHLTPTAAILIVQSGAVDIKLSGNSYTLMTGDYFEIPANIEHEVVGKEDSFLYLVK